MKYNDKSIGPVITFIIWLGLFGVICIVGISNVFAASYDYNDFEASLYDNYGPSLHYVLTTSVEGGGYTGTIGTMNANTSGAAWAFNSPIPLIAGRTYSISINPGLYNSTSNIVLSTYNRIGIGTTLSNAISSYENNTNANEITSRSTGKYIQYVFKPTINANFIVIPFATSSTISNASFALTNISLEDLGESSLDETTINNSLNNQTNELNNSITNSTNTITGAISETENSINSNIDDMEQSIVDSNKETQEVIKDQFNSCRDSKNLINQNNLTIGYISNDGVLHTGGDSSYTTDIISLSIGNYYLSGATLEKICYYNNGSFISCLTTKIPNFSVDNTFNGVRFQFTSKSLNGKLMLNEGSSALDYEPYGEQICTNKLDEANNQLDNLNNNLNNSNSSDATNSAGDFFSGFTTDTFGLTSIITAPLNLIGSITSSTCTPLGLPLPYVNKTLELPCMSSIYSQYFGSFFTLYQTITFGIIAYWVCVRIFNLVKDFKNPDHDEIEVLDL